MPYSVGEGRQYVSEWLNEARLERVIDIGPGAGAWRDALGPAHPEARWTAVEVWGPYVETFGLTTRYDTVIVADARYLDWAKLERFDLAVLGDVLEHMPSEDALSLLRAALAASALAVVSVPIIHYPQGAEMGNPYEAHLAHYTPETARALLSLAGAIVGESIGQIVGTYILCADGDKGEP